MTGSPSDIRRIVDYFGREASRRNRAFASDPVLMYEQLARQRRVRSMIEDSESLLDLGCGNARDLALYSNRANGIFGVDISLEMLREGRLQAEHAGIDVQYVVGDATCLPFREGSFDFALCSEVIEHIPKWRDALSNLHFVLKKSGTLVITTPNPFSMYGLQKPVVERLANHVVPFDSWKSWPQLKSAFDGHFDVTDVYGACILPGHITHAFVNLLKPLLPYVMRIEDMMCGHFPWKFLMYMVTAKLKKKEG